MATNKLRCVSHNFYKGLLLFALSFLAMTAHAQQPTVHDAYLKIKAGGNDPLFTTYAAAMDRSRLYGDKAYKLNYYSDDEPLNYCSDHSGRFYTIWRVNKVVIDHMADYHRRPVVTASFPDMVMLNYEPIKGLKVDETFLTYSSKSALVQQTITNTGNDTLTIDAIPVFELRDDTLISKSWQKNSNGFKLYHHESLKRVVSDLYSGYSYPTQLFDLFSASEPVHTYGSYSGTLDSFTTKLKTSAKDSLNLSDQGPADMVAMQHRFKIAPGETHSFRYIRATQRTDEPFQELEDEVALLKKEPLQPYVDANEKLFKSIPRINFQTNDEKLVYLGAFNLVRENMLPPTGKTSHNFYVFSRNPKWGWGHGHQVLHESLSMIPYVYLDPKSAEASQRVYMEQQGPEGLIAYRDGPRGAQTYPHKGEPTTSAPFFSWTNWEVYKVSKDRAFLEDAYQSGSKYVEWLEKHRDDDSDGLYEWGPYGLIENVRDWYNVIFQVSKVRHLDVDKEDISDELEDLDLSLMVANEMRYLSKMADALNKSDEAHQWKSRADELSGRINEMMWDKDTQFYYHVDKQTHEFKFMSRNLKRPEIIGFLPLWSKTATPERADVLLKKLTDPESFWRSYGVPTLSAADPYYSAYVDQCCKWNGPVWLLWDYMVFKGLQNYGYDDTAIALSNRMMKAAGTQLSRNHNFWESFSPDNEQLNSPRNYIWDSIMAKVLIEKYRLLGQYDGP